MVAIGYRLNDLETKDLRYKPKPYRQIKCKMTDEKLNGTPYWGTVLDLCILFKNSVHFAVSQI